MLRQLPRLLARPNLAGEGMLERLRTISFAMVGLTAAVALGLIALIAHQGWPTLAAIPIPELPFEHSGVQRARLVAGPRAPGSHLTLGANSARRSLDLSAGSGRVVGSGSTRPATRGSHQGIAALRSPSGAGSGSIGESTPRGRGSGQTTGGGAPPPSSAPAQTAPTAPSSPASLVESSSSHSNDSTGSAHFEAGGHWKGGAPATAGASPGFVSPTPSPPTPPDPGHGGESEHHGNSGQGESAAPANEEHPSGDQEHAATVGH